MLEQLFLSMLSHPWKAFYGPLDECPVCVCICVYIPMQINITQVFPLCSLSAELDWEPWHTVCVVHYVVVL